MSMIHILHPKAEQEADRRRLAARDEAAKAPTQAAAVSTSRPLTEPAAVASPAPALSSQSSYTRAQTTQSNFELIARSFQARAGAG